MAKALTSEQEALDEVREKINEVVGKRWMIAVWAVTEDDKGVPKTIEPVKRITWNFPTGDFGKAVGMLVDSVRDEGEAKIPPTPPPLKMAPLTVFDGDENKDPDDTPEFIAPEAAEGVPEPPPTAELQDGMPFPKPMSISEFMKGRERESEKPSEPAGEEKQ